MTFTLHHGDCIEVMRGMPDNCVDSIVTDPPYELGFMGKSWDSTGIAYSVELWTEALRVLKPGGHLLAFSGSRTYHRMACAIEDAGFEVRDQIMWLYGSGFPKSLDVAKAIDKMAGVEFEAKPASGVGFMNSSDDGYNTTLNQLVQTGESTDEANKWKGWGTALKPAHEPIVMARKPLSEKTVAKNVLQHGTGALNIDGSRIGTEVRTCGGMSANQPEVGTFRDDNWVPKDIEVTVSGRWPANVIHDGSDEVVDGFPDNGSAARFFYCAKANKRDRNEGLDGFEIRQTIGGGGTNPEGPGDKYGSVKAKAQNFHPTVKPVDLMRYLVKLITPPGGTVLDPFMGSGSTGKGAVIEGFNFVGIEQDADYLDIARARIQWACDQEVQLTIEEGGGA